MYDFGIANHTSAWRICVTYMTNVTAKAVEVETSPSRAVSSRDAPISDTKLKIHLKSHVWLLNIQTYQIHWKCLLFSSLQA